MKNVPGIITIICLAVWMLCFPLSGADGKGAVTEKEIRFTVGDITLAGTLSLPAGPPPFPAVVLVSGGAADDRDATVGPFKPFKVIARHLAEQGVAVLRYDDRGMGKSGGKHTHQYTMKDYSDDLLAAVTFLRKQSAVDKKKIGLCGHCLGGLISFLTYSRAKPGHIAFIVAMAGPAADGPDIWAHTREGYLTGLGKNKQYIRKSLELEQKIQAAVRGGGDLTELTRNIRANIRAEYDKLPPEQRKQLPFQQFTAADYDHNYLTVFPTPFYRDFLDFKPREFLEKVTCPLMLMLGGADLLVPLELNRKLYGEAMKKAGNRGFTLKVIPDAEHHFITGWSNPRFAPGFLTALSGWISKR